MLILLSLLSVSGAFAQEGFDAHGFRVASYDADLRDPLTFARPGTLEPMSWFAGGVLEYAKSPLVQESELTGAREAVLDHVIAANVSTGVAPHERLRFDLSAPLFLSSTGLNGPQGVGIGDVRLAALGLIVDPATAQGIGVGLRPFLDVPIGDDSEMLGQGQVSGGGAISGTSQIKATTLSAEVGAKFNPSLALGNVGGHDQVTLGMAVGHVVTEDVSLTLETQGLLPVKRNDVPGTGAPVEALLSVRHHPVHRMTLLGGLATALTPGAGAAAFRVVVGGAFGTGDVPPDSDGDGFRDPDDRCPQEAEIVNQFEDGDGCPDRLPQLRVSVRRAGASVLGADIRISGGEDQLDAVSRSTPFVVDSLPGRTWSVVASEGECWTGFESVETGSSDVDVEVELQPISRPVTFEASGPLGPVVADLVIEGGSSGCEARQDGQTAQLAPGSYEVVATSVGFEETRVAFEVGDDGATVPIAMQPIENQQVRVEPGRLVILEPVHFTSGRSTIQRDSFGILDAVADVLKASPAIEQVWVVGHTDNQGAADSNQRLSAKRAAAVVAYLTKQGVDAGRLQSAGKGEAEPISTNRTPGGRAENRRVEFLLEQP